MPSEDRIFPRHAVPVGFRGKNVLNGVEGAEPPDFHSFVFVYRRGGTKFLREMFLIGPKQIPAVLGMVVTVLANQALFEGLVYWVFPAKFSKASHNLVVGPGLDVFRDDFVRHANIVSHFRTGGRKKRRVTS